MFFRLKTEDRSICFWLLVGVLEFDNAFEGKDTETELEYNSESERVDGRLVFLGCT